MSTALTVGQIARIVGAAEHRVRYVIDTRQIAPCWRSGNMRLFDENASKQIARELERIRDKRRAAR